MSRVVPLLIVLALGGSAARWLASLLRELRHETYQRADAFLTSNALLIGQIFVVLGVKAVERVGKRFRRALAPKSETSPGQGVRGVELGV